MAAGTGGTWCRTLPDFPVAFAVNVSEAQQDLGRAALASRRRRGQETTVTIAADVLARRRTNTLCASHSIAADPAMEHQCRSATHPR
jgi:hypothetical protein